MVTEPNVFPSVMLSYSRPQKKWSFRVIKFASIGFYKYKCQVIFTDSLNWQWELLEMIYSSNVGFGTVMPSRGSRRGANMVCAKSQNFKSCWQLWKTCAYFFYRSTNGNKKKIRVLWYTFVLFTELVKGVSFYFSIFLEFGRPN